MKKMMILAIGLLVLTMISCTKTLTGTGAELSETRALDTFDKIRTNGTARVQIMYGPVAQVVISGYQNLLPYYKSQVVNGELILGYESDYNNIRNDNIRVNIILPSISGVYINGSGEIYIRNFPNGQTLQATINGSGNIDVYSSTFNKGIYDVNGSGDIHASTSQSNEAEATIHGSGVIAVNCAQKLTARIFGSGTIDYYGNPAVTDVVVSGSGQVRKK